MIERVTELVSKLEHDARARIALVAGLAVAVSGAAAVKTDAHEHAPVPGQLEQISDLPGYGIGLNQKAKKDIKSSSLMVENMQDQDNQVSMYDRCSGNVVSYLGTRYVALDAHCAVAITGNEFGNLNGKEYNAGKNGALDFIKADIYNTTVNDTNTEAGAFAAQIGKVTGMDVSMRNVDSELLKVTPELTALNEKGQKPTSLDQHYAIPYMATPKLVPGQEVALYSSPGSNTGPVAETGRYIGLAEEEYLDGDTIKTVKAYAVVTHPKTEAQDAGYWGSSGSEFAALATNKNGNTTGMDGKVVFSTGGLTRRFALHDASNPDATPAGSTTPITKLDEQINIDEIEYETGVKIPKNDTVLFYSKPSKTERLDLVDDFSKYITKYGG